MVRRYNYEGGDQYAMCEEVYGEYVEYDDYQKLEAENEALRSLNTELVDALSELSFSIIAESDSSGRFLKTNKIAQAVIKQVKELSGD